MLLGYKEEFNADLTLLLPYLSGRGWTVCHLMVKNSASIVNPTQSHVLVLTCNTYLLGKCSIALNLTRLYIQHMSSYRTYAVVPM